MKVFLRMFGKGWAQPVTSKRWAFACTLVSGVSRLTRCRVLNHRKHLLWERACGLS